MLGGFSVEVNGKPVRDRWRLRKAKTLVKLLALAPGHLLHRDVIVDMLWPDAEPEAAANNLYQVVHVIRHVLGAESITLSEDVVRLWPVCGDMTVDVDQFELAAAARPQQQRNRRVATSTRSVDRPAASRGRYADWAIEHQERLTETHAAVTTLLGSRLLSRGTRSRSRPG